MQIVQLMQRKQKVVVNSITSNVGFGTSGGNGIGSEVNCIVSASFYPRGPGEGPGRGYRIQFDDPNDFESFVLDVRQAINRSEIAQQWARKKGVELKKS